MKLNASEREALLSHARRGQGPFYAYFHGRIDRRKKMLRNALPAEVSIHYSLKANPLSEVIQFFKEFGADVASDGELIAAGKAGFSMKQTSFVGPGKSDRELELGLKMGCGLIVLESEGEARRLSELARVAGKIPDVLVRVNPRSWIGLNGRKFENVSSQFGIDEESVVDFLKSSRGLNLRVRGLHAFTGSQHLNAENIAANIGAALTLSASVEKATGLSFDILDAGGGFGVPYFTGDQELDTVKLRTSLDDLMKTKHERLKVVVESGRYLVAESGFYVARVVDKKVSRGRSYSILEGGINHHLASTGYGQGVKRNFPVEVLERADGMEKATIAGPTCYSLDVMGNDVELPLHQVGDHLVFGFSGAYGRSFSPSGFLSRPSVEEIVLAI